MADRTIAINRDIRGYRNPSYVFRSNFDETSGDCDTKYGRMEYATETSVSEMLRDKEEHLSNDMEEE